MDISQCKIIYSYVKWKRMDEMSCIRLTGSRKMPAVMDSNLKHKLTPITELSGLYFTTLAIQTI